MHFSFPQNRQAKELGTLEQFSKVAEEFEELKAEIGKDDMRTCCEAWDLIHATEGIIRKFPEDLQERSHAEVFFRCSRRGDYGDISDII